MTRYFRTFFKAMAAGILLFTAISSFSQAKPDTTKTVKPILTGSFGPYTGGKTLVADLKKLAGLNPLVKVKDAKGLEYKVISYEIMWKKKELSDDIKTGKPKTVFYTVGADVTGNTLPDNWKTDLSTGVQAGEVLMITDIIYFDPKKKTNYKLPGMLTISII